MERLTKSSSDWEYFARPKREMLIDRSKNIQRREASLPQRIMRVFDTKRVLKKPMLIALRLQKFTRM